MTNQPSLDRAVDDVARRMTAQEPPAELRARVMARIHERAAPHGMWRFAPIAAGVVAVAAIGYALTIAPTAPTARRAAAPSPIAPTAPAAVAPALVAVTNASASAAAAPAIAATSSAKASAEPTEEELAWLARAVPALEQPAALGVDAIQPEALTIHQIDVKPLVTEPLSMSPGEGGGVKR